jgi:hypothetical protein
LLLWHLTLAWQAAGGSALAVAADISDRAQYQLGGRWFVQA